MNEYTIYCNPIQTKKALELGAPIEKDWIPECLFNNDYFSLKNPTAEQMISWFEDKSLQVTIRFRGNSWYYDIMSGYNVLSIGKDVSTRKEATLNAIDTALEYLINNQK